MPKQKKKKPVKPVYTEQDYIKRAVDIVNVEGDNSFSAMETLLFEGVADKFRERAIIDTWKQYFNYGRDLEYSFRTQIRTELSQRVFPPLLSLTFASLESTKDSYFFYITLSYIGKALQKKWPQDFKAEQRQSIFDGIVHFSEPQHLNWHNIAGILRFFAKTGAQWRCLFPQPADTKRIQTIVIEAIGSNVEQKVQPPASYLISDILYAFTMLGAPPQDLEGIPNQFYQYIYNENNEFDSAHTRYLAVALSKMLLRKFLVGQPSAAGGGIEKFPP